MHLDIQKGVYYAQLRVPKDAQEVIGKTAFRKTLQTRDKLEAQQRAIPLIQQWKAEIEVARLPQADRLNSQLSALSKSLSDLEKELTKPSLPKARHAELEDLKFTTESIIQEDILAAYKAKDAEELSDSQLIEAQASYMLATGQSTPFLEYLEAYLEDSQVENKTKQMKRTQITCF